MKNKVSFFLVLLLCLSGLRLSAEDELYRSGFLKDFSLEIPPELSQTEQSAIEEFFRHHFGNRMDSAEWRVLSRTTDGTHSHLLYALYYKGRRVDGEALNLHYNLKGWVEYATSTLEDSIALDLDVDSSHAKTQIIQLAKKQWTKATGVFQGTIDAEPIVWLDPQTKKPRAAFEVWMREKKPFRLRHLILEEKTGALMEEKRRIIRNVSASVKAYKVSPFGSGTPVSVTVTVDEATKLANSFFRVRREENPSAPSLVDVIPQDFTGSGFTTDPTTYAPSCTGNGSACMNQAFDATNVYYHLANYRDRIAGYLSTLSATVSFPYDPLNVLINPLSVDFEGNGDPLNQTNNAMYVGQDCRSDGSMPRCLVFLRPAPLSGPSVCGSGTVQFYDLAREAVVVAHEYQHYVTDMVTHIQFATSSAGVTVGDALHEGYSDYLAASYVTDLAATDVTLVGEYALQACSTVQRQVGTVRVFLNGTDEKDPHTSGLSWASALWKLRTELGAAKTDLLVVKSLFFLSTRPGFVESIESLVKADTALNGGANVARIRQLLYDQVQFMGGQTGNFRDTSSGVAEVGFRGCASVSKPNGEGNRFFLFTMGLWLILTLSLGRFRISSVYRGGKV